MSLSGPELTAVRKTWSVVKQDFTSHGLSFYRRLFQKYPDHKEKFAYVRGLKEDVYMGSSGLKNQALKTMKKLDELISHLEDKDALVKALSDLAKMHQGISVSDTEFVTFKIPLLESLRADLGTQFTADAERGYTKFADFVATTFSSFY